MKKENRQKPFFAGFLENQMRKEESGILFGGVTTRLTDLEQTDKNGDIESQKYPSDNDEEGTLPDLDAVFTHKFPSDSDEEGSV